VNIFVHPFYKGGQKSLTEYKADAALCGVVECHRCILRCGYSHPIPSRSQYLSCRADQSQTATTMSRSAPVSLSSRSTSPTVATILLMGTPHASDPPPTVHNNNSDKLNDDGANNKEDENASHEDLNTHAQEFPILVKMTSHLLPTPQRSVGTEGQGLHFILAVATYLYIKGGLVYARPLYISSHTTSYAEVSKLQT
jgi:hypothetical protein